MGWLAYDRGPFHLHISAGQRAAKASATQPKLRNQMINPTLISREIELDLAKLQLLSKVAADDNDFPVHIDTNLRRQKTTLDIIEYTSKLDCALIHAARSACEVARWASTLASITGLRQQCNATRSGIHVCHGVKHCYVAIHSRYDQGLGLNLLVRSHMHGTYVRGSCTCIYAAVV